MARTKRAAADVPVPQTREEADDFLRRIGDPALRVEDMDARARTAEDLLGGVSSELMSQARAAASAVPHDFHAALSDLLDRALEEAWSVDRFRAAMQEMVSSHAASSGAPSPEAGAAAGGGGTSPAANEIQGAIGGEATLSADDTSTVTGSAPAAVPAAEPFAEAASGPVSDAGQPVTAGDGDVAAASAASAEQKAGAEAGSATSSRQRRKR